MPFAFSKWIDSRRRERGVVVKAEERSWEGPPAVRGRLPRERALSTRGAAPVKRSSACDRRTAASDGEAPSAAAVASGPRAAALRNRVCAVSAPAAQSSRDPVPDLHVCLAQRSANGGPAKEDQSQVGPLQFHERASRRRGGQVIHGGGQPLPHGSCPRTPARTRPPSLDQP